MSKTIKIILVILIIDAVLVGGYFGYRAITAGKPKTAPEDFEWVTVDEYYEPQNYIETFIKNDSAQKGLFPVYLRSYGRDASILRRFRGSNFAGPTEAQLNMMYKGLEDWILLDIKYKNEKDREVLRTVLYVMVKGEWRVGDSGRLLQ